MLEAGCFQVASCSRTSRACGKDAAIVLYAFVRSAEAEKWRVSFLLECRASLEDLAEVPTVGPMGAYPHSLGRFARLLDKTEEL